MQVFRRQCGDRFGIYVGRVRDDQVELATSQLGEGVGLDQFDAVSQVVIGDVALGDGESVVGEVNGGDFGIREGEGAQDGQAAGAGAQVEGGFDGPRVVDPRRQLLVEQFGDEGARHDDAVVDVETMFAEPGFVGQVGSWQALLATAPENIQQRFTLVRQQTGIEKRFEAVERQIQRVQREISRFVPGVVTAMAEKQAGGIEAADGVTKVVANGDQFGLGSSSHAIRVCSRMRV